MQRPWRVGWKPIDQASAEPKWSGIIFDDFAQASGVAKALNASDPENHYFPDLIPEKKPEQCTDCGRIFESEKLKPPPDPKEVGRLCPSCHEAAVHEMTIK